MIRIHHLAAGNLHGTLFLVDNRTGSIISLTQGVEYMKITYDKQADAACVMIADHIHDVEAAIQLHSIKTPGGEGEVTLDFDRNGKLLGMEILGPEQVLQPEVLARAELPATDPENSPD